MFASRSKTALPSKRMQVLRDLAWREEVCVENWIEIAKALAKDRVVVKRRSKDPVSTTPDWQVKGRQVRFDVYRTG
jgi:16S rRNA (guanine1516-N2)-methyltransferase